MRSLLLVSLLGSAPALAVIGGSPDTAHPSAVFIKATVGSQTGYCSGVVVAPRVVLTAGHCTNLSGVTYQVFVGEDFRRPDAGTFVAVSEYHAHPSYSAATNAYDVGVLITATDIDTPPAPLNRSPPAVGDTVSIVGYGQTIAGNASTLGKRMVASTQLTAVSALDFTIQGTPSFCLFDSGGPSYLATDAGEAVAGIHFIVESAACNARAYDVRVDRITGFVDGYIAAHTVDAGSPVVDAGLPEVDAGAPEPDAGAPEVDAGPPLPDAGAPMADREPPQPRMGCSVAGLHFMLLAWVLALRRRRS